MWKHAALPSDRSPQPAHLVSHDLHVGHVVVDAGAPEVLLTPHLLQLQVQLLLVLDGLTRWGHGQVMVVLRCSFSMIRSEPGKFSP